MLPTKTKSSWEIPIVAIVCLAVGGGLGYWQGQRAAQPGIAAARVASLVRSSEAQVAPTPPNASPEMKEFLANQVTLAQKMQEARGSSTTLTPQAFALFRQQNAQLLQRQNELAQTIAQQQDTGNTLSAPPPVQMPPDASPQLQAYLTAKDKLMRDQIAFLNQHKSDDLAAQQAAMEKWRKQNADRIQQLQKMAQTVAPSGSSTLTGSPGR